MTNDLGHNAPSGDVALLREFLKGRAMFDHARLDDESLQAVIDGAKEWIGGRRWSWKIVATNYLQDGRYHA